MSDTARRPWFRFHLLTAVLMMVATGGMLGVNFRNANKSADPNVFTSPIYGWPFVTYSNYFDDQVKAGHVAPSMVAFDVEMRWHFAGVAMNCGILVFALALIAFISEHLLRRRSASET
jgi:hypothetical protein